MSSVFQKLLPSFLRQDTSTMFPDDDFIDDDPLESSSSSSASDSPEPCEDAIDTFSDIPTKRNTDRPINPRKLPEEFLEALSDVIAEEEDPYTKLIIYSNVVCGTRIDVLRDRFVVSTPRGKHYIASREFVRHRLNKSLERIRERFYEINGGECHVSTIDDSDEPYRAEVASGKSSYSPPESASLGSLPSSSTLQPRGATIEHEIEEEHEPDFPKTDIQGTNHHQEKRSKFPRKKLLFVLDEEDYEETDSNGFHIPSSQGKDM